MTARLIPDSQEGWNNVPCPHCGYVETLSSDIQDIWTCDSCKQNFWILPMLLISSKPPRVEYDMNGQVVSWQLSLAELSFDTNYHAEDSTTS